MQAFDVELLAQDILALRDADSIAAFFTGLGYDTAARIPQTPVNLGLSEPVQKRVKRLELIADQAKLFQVYLFELQSVTVADIRRGHFVRANETGFAVDLLRRAYWSVMRQDG